MTELLDLTDVEPAIRALDSVRRDWLHRPGVTGADIGFKIVGDELTDQLAVRVHVRRKVDPETLHPTEVFNITGEPDAMIGEFPVDVLEAEYAPEAAPGAAAPQAVSIEAVSRAGTVSPLVGGLSVGNARATAGTLGAIVWDRRDCSVNMLSNWHVLAGIRRASAGETILQPGPLDGGRDRNRVASLNRWRLDRSMDAAIARLDRGRAYTRDIIGVPALRGITAPVLGMPVVKSGRSTGITHGIIDGLDLTIPVTYETTTQTLHDQIHIVPGGNWPRVDYELTRDGDSGSVWIEEATGLAVGLHFAGETDTKPRSEMAAASRMDLVERALEISVMPLVCRDWTAAIMDRWPWLGDRQLEAAVESLHAWPEALTGLPAVADPRVTPPPAPGSEDEHELRRTLQEIRAALDVVIARLG